MKRKITLREIDDIDNKTSIFRSFKKDFKNEVLGLILDNPDHWTNGTIRGSLCEIIEKTNDFESDCVSIPIENSEAEDGGYVHVWGWAEA